jgi:hypothetical protein
VAGGVGAPPAYRLRAINLEGNMAQQTAIDDTIKQAVLALLRRGIATQSEAARLSGRSRQIVRHWAKDLPESRCDYLNRQWQSAINRAKK